MLHDTRAMGLLLHEMFDLQLYKRFVRRVKSEDLRAILITMIAEEERHISIWKKYVPHAEVPRLSLLSHLKMMVFIGCARIFGDTAIRIIVEAIEVHGIRAYLLLAHSVAGTALEEPLDEILRDELEHEAQIVGDGYSSQITGERVRSFILGFNDGLVEMLGATVGFYATLSHPSTIVLAGLSVLSAGSFSMAAGAYAADRAEHELDTIREAKMRFLETGHPTVNLDGTSAVNAAIVGGAFIVGGLLPLAPVFLGSMNFILSVAAAFMGILVISVALAFLTGISIRKRIMLNLGLVTAAVVFALAVGSIVDFVVG